MTSKRTERIEGALRGAMLELLKEKPFEKITVKEIVERAGVSKGTLYAHYDNLHALMCDCFFHEQVYYGPLKKRLGDYGGDYAGACRECLDNNAQRLMFFRAYPNLAKVFLFEAGISPYFEKAVDAEVALHVDHLVVMYGETCRDYLRIEHIARMIFEVEHGMLRAWYRAGMSDDIERVVKEISWCTFHLAAGAVERSIEPVYRDVLDSWHFEG